jgi:hypothetical protein
MDKDDVMTYAKRLEEMAAEEKDEEKSTAMAAGMAALLYMRGKHGQTGKPSHSEYHNGKEGTGKVGTGTEARSDMGLHSNASHTFGGKIRLLEEDEKMIADEIREVFSRNHIYGTDLRGMEQINAELCFALLYGRDLWACKNLPFMPISCPSEGEFTAWKKAERYDEPVLIKLTIPADAVRTSGVTRMARADKAWCDEIISTETGERYEFATSLYDPDFIYRTGEMAYSKGFCRDRRTDYCNGIHFFIDREEALRY